MQGKSNLAFMALEQVPTMRVLNVRGKREIEGQIEKGIERQREDTP